MKHLEQFLRFPGKAPAFTVIKLLLASVVLVSSLAGAGGLHAASTLQFSATSYTVAENAGAASLSVERLDDLDTVVSVDYASVDGTNEVSKEVFEFESSLYTVSELDGDLKITIVRSGSVLGYSQVKYATTDATATAGLDYWADYNTAYFGPGQTNATFYLNIIEDSIPEGDEAVVLALSDPASSSGNQVVLGKQSTALVTIKNAGNALQFLSDFYSVSESNQLAVVVVQRPGDTNLACTVRYATSDLTARAGKDYVAQSGTLAFLPGQVTNVFTVPILDNFVVDGSRLIKLTLCDPSGGSVLAQRTTAILSILDDEWPVVVDPSFSVNLADDSTVNALVALPDGKILLAGAFRFVGDTNRLALARLNPDGSRDTAFKEAANVNGRLALVSALVVAPDGKLVLNGQIIDSQQNYSESVLRLGADGALDTTFKSPEIGPGNFTDLAVQTDGKILVVGTFTTLAQASRNGIARLNRDGALDPTFNPGSGASYVNPYNVNDPTVYADVAAVRVQPDGRIIIAGRFQFYNGVKRPGIARLNSDGSLDTSFAPGAGATNLQFWLTVPPPIITTLAIQADGGILLGGSFYTSPPTILARLNGDGSLDSSYRFPLSSGTTRKILVQSDGKIVIGGGFFFHPQGSFNLVRLNPDGSLDPSLSLANYDGGPGSDYFGEPTALVQLPDGNLLVAGIFTQQVLRLFADTTKRHTIAFASPFASLNENETNVGLTLRRGGDTTESISVTVSSIDETAKAGRDYPAVNQVVTFAPGETTKEITVSTLDDGLVEETESFLVTLHDPTAGVELGANSRLGVAVSDNETSPSISREFAPGVDGAIHSAVAQLDGKVIIAGDLNSVDGVPAHRIARLNPDGSLDTSFTITEGVTPDGFKCCDSFSLIRVQLDGKILLNGSFSDLSGAQQFRFVRLNTDGSFDTGFNPALEPNEYLQSVELEADAKILLATGSKVRRLNPNGSADHTFSEGITKKGM